MTNVLLSRFIALSLCIGMFFAQTTVTINYSIPQKYLNKVRVEAINAQENLKNSQEWKQREESRYKNRLYGYFGVPTLGGVVAAVASCYSGDYGAALAFAATGAGIGAGAAFVDYNSKKESNEVELDLEVVRVLHSNSSESNNPELDKARFETIKTIKQTYCNPRYFVKETERYTASKRIGEGFLASSDDKYENTVASKDIWGYGISPTDEYAAELAFGVVKTASEDVWDLQLREEVGHNLKHRNSSELSRLAKKSMTTI